MLVKTYSAAVNGLDVTTVTVEVNIIPGVMYRMTGLGDTAVREGRVHVMDGSLFNLKPNSRWGEAYEQLAEILYGQE